MTKAKVLLFKPNGKYYTEEEWEIPEGAIGPYDMKESKDFRRIDGGSVLVDTQEPWGFPHLFPGRPPTESTILACAYAWRYASDSYGRSAPTAAALIRAVDEWDACSPGG